MRSTSSGSVRIFWPDFDRTELIRALGDGAERLARELPLVKVVLFGSHARGAATAASDVDVVIVYRGEPREDAFALSRRLLAVRRLEPHVYTETEFEASRPVLERMLRDGVTILPRPA